MENIIEFKGINTSWSNTLNLLQKEKNVYVMDNHNAALWCWLQEIDLKQEYNVLHIDRHYDTCSGQLEEWLSALPKNMENLSIDEYLSCRYNEANSGDLMPVMTWDNYFPIFHRRYRKNIKSYHFFTHREISLFDEMKSILTEYPVNGLFNLMDYFFNTEETGEYKWIVNIDLDYFYQQIDYTDTTLRMFSYEAIGYFLNKLKVKLKEGRIAVLTIALSPECCGNWESWDNSIILMKFFAEQLDIEFDIN